LCSVLLNFCAGWGGCENERVPRADFVSPLCVKDAKRLGIAFGEDILRRERIRGAWVASVSR
jgi:hypothetical protein